MSKEYYKQGDGKDSWRVLDDDGHTKYSGHCTYNEEDGSVERWDNVSSFDGDRHVHEWMNKQDDGSYEYGSHDKDGHHHND